MVRKLTWDEPETDNHILIAPMSELLQVRMLADDWREAGVKEGGILLIHSSIRRTLMKLIRSGIKASPEIILRSFLEAVGEQGTLLFPLFNFDFTTGKLFDIRHTKSNMGALTEAARNWPNAVRTGHPIYSFAAIGNKAGLFRGLCNFSGYGADSPFGILHQNDGQIGSLDLADQDSMTFYHYVEEMHQVPYRFHKEFSGPYIDFEGVESERVFGIFVRDIAKGVVTRVNPMGARLWEIGAYKGSTPNNGSGLRTIGASRLYEEVSQVIKSGSAKGLLYEIEK